MKKISYSILYILLMCYSHLFSQNYFSQAIGGGGIDEYSDIKTDAIGNIYGTGYFNSSTANFVSLSLTNYSATSTLSDVFITKSDAYGSLLWSVKGGGLGQDRGKAIGVDNQGNVYVTGTFTDSAIFGNNTLIADSGSVDIFLCKLDNAGNYLWAKNYGGQGGDVVNGLAVDNQGNVIITGQYKGTGHFGTNTITSTLDTSGTIYSYDIFILKVSSNGTITWLKTGAAPYDDRANAVTTDANDNIFVLGQFSDTIQFNQTYTNSIYNVGFVLKLDAAGNELGMSKHSASSISPNSICVNDSNQVLVCGDFTGNLMVFSSPPHQLTNPNTRKVYILKFDNSLNYIYSKAFGSSKALSAKKICATHDDNFYVYGEFKCTLSEFSAMFGSGVFNSMGYRDLFVAKFSNNGSLSWPRQIGGPEDDVASGLAIDSQNRPILAGSFAEKMYMPLSHGAAYQENNYNINMLLNEQNYNTQFFCNDFDYNYYAKLGGNTFSDGFITNLIDTTRQPLDYFLRNNIAACNRDRLTPCIASDDLASMPFYFLTNCLNDTVEYCGQGNLSLNFNTGIPGECSPKYNWTWSAGGNTYQNNVLLSVTNSQFVTLSTTTKDGCYTGSDSIYVIVHPLPAEPFLTDNQGINTNSPYPTLPINLCGTTFPNVTFTASNVGNNQISWTPQTVTGNTYTITDLSLLNQPIQCTATDNFGCKRSNYMYVNYDSTSTTINTISTVDTNLTLCKGSDYVYYLKEVDAGTGNTTYPTNVTITTNPPIYSSGLVQFANLDTLMTGIMLQPPDSSGTYVFDITISRINSCDTIYQYLHITHHITVVDGVEIHPTVDTLFACSSQNVTLYSTSPTPPLWSLTNTIADSISFNNYYGYITASNSLPSYTTTGYEQNCSSSIYISNNKQPKIETIPGFSTICPNDSLMLVIDMSGNNTFHWYGPNGIMPAFTDSFAYAKTPGAYYCEVINQFGCTVTSLIQNCVAYNTPYLVAQPDAFVCFNEPIDLNVMCNDDALVIWDAPLFGGGLTQTITQPGTYSCSATSCGITTTCSMIVSGSNLNLNMHITGPSDVHVCGQNFTTLQASSGASTFIWSDGNMSQNINVVSDGSYYVVGLDSAGCPDTSQVVNVFFHPDFPAPIVTADTVCYNETATLFADSLVNISWYYDSLATQYITTANYANINFVAQDMIVYVAATNDPECPAKIVPGHIYLDPNAYPPPISGDTTTCNLAPVQLYTASLPNTTYSWTGPGGFGNNNDSILISNSGFYQLSVNRNGCQSAPSNVHVTNISAPAPSITADTTLCVNENLSIQALSNLSNISWYAISNTAQLLTTSTISATNAQLRNDGNYQFFYDYQGCRSDTNSIYVHVNNVPQVSMDSLLILCFGQPIQVSPTYSSITNTFWTYPDNTIHQSNSLNFTAADTLMNGNYTFHAGLYGCYNDSHKVRVDVNYEYKPIINSPYNTCVGQSLALNMSNERPNRNYQWSSSNGISFITHGDTTITSVGLQHAGIYQLIAQGPFCSSQASSFVLNVQEIPSAMNIHSSLPACAGDNIKLWVDSSSAQTANWSGPNNLGANQDTLVLYSANNVGGSYSVYPTTSFGCQGATSSYNVFVNPLPQFSLGNDTTICNYNNFNLQGPASYASYVWNTSETTSSINITSSNQYTLEVTDDKGCSSKDSININVLNCNVRLSNVMTPDANGLNDMFFQGGEDLVSFHLLIFNRWGTKIHETTTNEKKWSCNCDAGTYYYTIEAIDIYQQKGTWSGFFTLIK